MKIQIEVDTDNAAFGDDSGELFRVLRDAAWQAHKMVNDIEASGVLHDINGNTVGHVHIGDSALERDAIAKKARQEEKRKWFEKVKSKEFWLALIKGADGVEGVEYAEEVYDILYEIMGERG